MYVNRFLLAATAGLAYMAQVQADHHLVNGAPLPPDGSIPLRRNVDVLEAENGPQWDLYIQALLEMQNMDSKDQLSYFQLSGIHGSPYLEWDNAGAQQGDGWLGYCPHGEDIFLPWHRPYVLLFEEQLVKHALKIAQGYPEKYRDQYVAAAQTLRAPYWDWADQSAVPYATIRRAWPINVASGKGITSEMLANPLRRFIMPKAALSGTYGPFDQRTETYRCRVPYFSYPGSADQYLRTRNLKRNLYATFVYAQDFNQFSQTGNQGVGLEQIHNWIHGDASCGNQFFEPALSAFDPLFMLHHANVDRLWAYWQYIRPDQAIFSDSYNGHSRFGTPQGSLITPDSDLQPFSATQDGMHTPKTVASMEGMGYSYEGLAYWNMSSVELQKAATVYINTEYGDQTAWKRDAGGEDSKPPSTGKHGHHDTHYFVRFEIDRSHVDRPSTVSVYIGAEKAGDVSVMPHPAIGIMKGSFAIDKFVHSAYNMTANSNGTVSSIAHLVRMRVTKPDGTIVPLSSIPSMKLSLEEVLFTAPASIEQLPVPGTPNIHEVEPAEHTVYP